jgi:hypothetical protein
MKINPDETCKIAENWKNYLKKQIRRLANSRKIKNKEKIDKLIKN